jgi:beta-glucosidase
MLQAWYGGQEAGNALADVLLGTVNPSGRMPITWPKRYADLPFASEIQSWPGVDGTVTYKEECQVGYRWYSHHPGVEPQWWFGYGQSYTNFTSRILKVDEASERKWNIQVEVTNRGSLSGSEVVQVYLWLVYKKEDIALVGFEKTKDLEPGETGLVNVVVKKRDAARWSVDKWVLAQGEYILGLGQGVGTAGISTWQFSQPEMSWKP